jgi:hypothetical protein
MHWIDPNSLPELQGTLERFVLNPHGEVDGFIMTGAQQAPILVHTPPHLEAEITRHVKLRDVVRVRGVRLRGADLVAAVAVTASCGTQIIDNGPDHDREHPKPARKKMSAEGTVRLSLFGPKGELRGALLADGTVIRVGPKDARALASLLAPNATVAVSGDGVQTPQGRAIAAKEIGTEPGKLQPIREDKPKPRHEGKPKHRHDHAAVA